MSDSEGMGWPDQPSRRAGDGRAKPTSAGMGWPDQPSRHVEPKSDPVPDDPEALADAVIKQRGH